MICEPCKTYFGCLDFSSISALRSHLTLYNTTKYVEFVPYAYIEQFVIYNLKILKLTDFV